MSARTIDDDARRLEACRREALLDAARNTVAYYAGTQPGRFCLADELNPCGGLRHWGGGPGCPLCSARAALRIATGSPA